MRHIWLCAALVAALFCRDAAAQAVLQAGPSVGGHGTMYEPNGTTGFGPATVQDEGPAGGFQLGQGLSETLQVNRFPGTGPFGAHNCEYDQPSQTGSLGYHYLCFDSNAQGGGLIEYGAAGGASPLPLQCSINGVTSACLTPSIAVVPTQAALLASPSTIGSPVLRQDWSSNFGAPPLLFFLSQSACTIPGGDGGTQVPTADGKCWLAESTAGHWDIQEFGGGNGTNDTAALLAATTACNAAGGGQIRLRPLGHAYVIPNGITITANSCIIHGDTHGFWKASNPVFDNVEADYTGFGTWIRCDDTVTVSGNPCINLTGDGSGLEGINFWHTQPTPPSPFQCATPCVFTHNWTPKPYAFDVTVSSLANHVRLRDLSFVNSTNCADLEGPQNGIAGIGTSLEHINFGCASIGMRARFQDNAVILHDIHHELWWFQGSPDWWGWMEGNNSHTDWDVCYFSSPYMTDVEFAFSGLAMKVSDCVVTSGFGMVTLGIAAMVGTNVSFNEVCQAIQVQTGTTHLTGNLSNVVAFADTTTSQGPVGQCANQSAPLAPGNFLFQVNSDNVDLYLNGVNGGFVQGFAYIGAGGAGPVHAQLHIGQLTVANYSAFGPNTPLILTDNTGSIVEPANLNFVYSAGPLPGLKCAGNGCLISTPYNEIAAHLPNCANGNIGAMIYVTDLASQPVYLSGITTSSGSGTNRALAICNGINWTAH